MISELQPINTWPPIDIKWDCTVDGLNYCDFDFENGAKFIWLDINDLKKALADADSLDDIWNGITNDKIVSIYNAWASGIALSPPSIVVLESGKVRIVDGWHRLKVAYALKESKISFAIRKNQFPKFRELFDNIGLEIDRSANYYGHFYLYGKYAYLKNVIENKEGIRFSDIRSYIKLENNAIRDDESIKKWYLIRLL